MRSLLRDNGRGIASNGTTFTDSEIQLALESARSETIDHLLQMCDIVGAAPDFQSYVQNYSEGAAFPATRPRITLSRLMSTEVIAADEQDLPDNFYKIECASDADLGYVPSQPMTLARSMAGKMPVVYATGGQLYYTGSLGGLLYYWRMPDTPIADNALDLTDIDMGMTDSFYNCVKYLAAARLVVKHGAENRGFAAKLGEIYMRKLQTLR